MYKGRDLTVSGLVKPGDKIGTIEAIALPGHTFGHLGYCIDGVLYAGDAVFGDPVLAKYGVPYLMDIDLFVAG